MVWLGVAAVVVVGLSFAGLAVVSRAMSQPAVPTPGPPTKASTVSSPAGPAPTNVGTPTAKPTVSATQPPANDAVITSVAGRFVDAWLQRDRAKRKTQLAQTAVTELAAALMRTDPQNIPRLRKHGVPTIDSRAEGVAVVLQPMTGSVVLRITVVAQPGTVMWLVSDVDMPAA